MSKKLIRIAILAGIIVLTATVIVKVVVKLKQKESRPIQEGTEPEQQEQLEQPEVIDQSTDGPSEDSSGNSLEEIDTSDWKTYRNKKYGIEFKYPPYEDGWTLEEFDYSKNKSSLLYPMKGIFIFYDFKRLQGIDTGSERLSFFLKDDPFAAGNTHLRDPENPNVYTFDFQGQRAVGDLEGKHATDSFFLQHKCISAIGFGLPDLPKPWESNETVTLMCGNRQAPKENPYIFKAILDSIHFSQPIQLEK